MTSYSAEMETLRARNRLTADERLNRCRAKRLACFRRYLGYGSPFKYEPLPDKITETLVYMGLKMDLTVDLTEAKKNLLEIGNMEFFYDQIEEYVEMGWEWPDE